MTANLKIKLYWFRDQGSSSLFDKTKNTYRTENTSFGHITTQQSQPLNKVTTSPNIWKFPCVYSAHRLEVSLNIGCTYKVTGYKTWRKKDNLKFAFTLQLTVMSSPLHSILSFSLPSRSGKSPAEQCAPKLPSVFWCALMPSMLQIVFSTKVFLLSITPRIDQRNIDHQDAIPILVLI